VIGTAAAQIRHYVAHAKVGTGRQLTASYRSVRPTAVVIVLSLLFTSACGSSEHRVAASGTLTGKLEAVGGPPGVAPRLLPGTLTISGGSGTRIRTTAADGAFSVKVPSGSYTVVGQSPQFLTNGGEGQCFRNSPGALTVRSGAISMVLVVCSER
jgi:hypothetical protein